VVGYTSYTDADHPGPRNAHAAAVFEDCCLAVEEALNSVYRQGRATDRSIGPLEIRVVPDGTFDKLMDYPRPCGASINQYKAPDDRAILGTVN